MNAQDIEALNETLQQLSPREILATLLPIARSHCSFVQRRRRRGTYRSLCKAKKLAEQSGADSGISLYPFTLDTGRLPAATYRFLERVRNHYSLELDVLMPNAEAVNSLVREKGLFSFYKDGHKECCEIRKVAPLRSHLANFDAWITGNVATKAPPAWRSHLSRSILLFQLPTGS